MVKKSTIKITEQGGTRQYYFWGIYKCAKKNQF